MNFFSKLKPANPGSSTDLRAALEAAEAEIAAITQRRDDAQEALTDALFNGDAKAAEAAAKAEETATLDLARLSRLTARYGEAISAAEQGETAKALEARALPLAARSTDAAAEWRKQLAALKSFRAFAADWVALSGRRASLLAELTSANTNIAEDERERIIAILGDASYSREVDLALSLVAPQVQALLENWGVR